MIKPRHMTLSDTLESKGLKPAMRDSYFLMIEKPPLLTAIMEQLAESRLFSNRYLKSFSDRMCRIADTIGFLSAYQCSSSQDFHRKLKQASVKERRHIRKRLCNFGLEIFHDLGRDIVGLATLDRFRSRFLKPMIPEYPPLRSCDLYPDPKEMRSGAG